MDQCKDEGDGALELGVLAAPTPPADPRYWKLTGLLSLLDKGGRLLSEAWCETTDRAPLLEPERGKDTVEGEESSPIGLPMIVVAPEAAPSAT